MLGVEAVGALAAAAQLLVYLGRAIEGLYGTVQEGRYVDENVANLVRELKHTKWFLYSCEQICASVLSEELGDGFYREELLAMKHEAQLLQELLRKVQPQGEVNKYQWILKSSRCKELALEMSRSRVRLQQTLIVLQIRYSDMILRRNPEAAEAFYTAIDLDQKQEQTATIEVMDGNDVHVKSSFTSSATTLKDPSALIYTSATSPNWSRGSFIGPQRPNENVCAKDCICTCHVSPVEQSSTQPVRTSLSPIDYRLGTLVTSPRCSDVTCRISKQRKALFVAPCPVNLFARIFTVSLLRVGLKTSARLETPRYVPEDSDVVRATLNGDLDWLKRIFSAKLGSPNDSSIDGWSLLHTAAYYSQLEVAKFLICHGARVEVVELNNRTPFQFSMIKCLKQNASIEHKQLAELMWHEISEADCAQTKEEKFIQELQFTPIHACVLQLHDQNYESPRLAELLDLAEQAKNNVQGRDWQKWKDEFLNRSPCYVDVLTHAENRAKDVEKKQMASFCFKLDLIDLGDIHNWTPLHWAAYTGRFEEVKILVEHNANILHQTSSRRNVFHHAAESGHGKMMAYLAQRPYFGSNLNINHQDLWGETPLYIAAARTAESVEHLLKLNARVSIKQAENRNPLHEAYQADDANRMDIVTRLCDNDPTSIHAVDDGGKTPIFEYVKDVKCFAMLVKRGAKLDFCDGKKRNLFHHAGKSDSADVLELLFAHFRSKTFGQHKLHRLGHAKDIHGSTPLREAFFARSGSCVQLLLALKGIRIEPFVGPDGWTVLHHAARLGDLKVLTYVLRSGRWEMSELLRLTVDGKTAEQIACDEGNYHGAFKELLDTVRSEQQRSVALGMNAMTMPENSFYYASMMR